MRALLGLILLVLIALPATATASPVATSDGTYSALGRVFPDPLAGCAALGSPCDPNAQGNTPALSFIGINEFHDALAYMNSKPEWQRYMEVITLDGRDGDGSATKAQVTADPKIMFPGNNLPPEFSPQAGYQSAGLPTSQLSRQKSDLNIVRVTDESVPDANKVRYTLSLSIHGIERAGVEGGTRAMEELVTAVTTGKLAQPVLPADVRANAPTFDAVLRNAIIYFTYPNPDGWRRGTYDTGGLGSSFQRYNGNGIDPNRDYTDIGYNYRGYSGGSEPETRAFKGFYRDVLGSGGSFQAGDDLHGQPFADALSYTLLPHGRHDLAKDTRIREAAKLINRAQYFATKYDPRIMENVEVSSPQTGCAPDTLGAICPTIYAQTWGSVYDTINYTTTGTTGDYFDSSIGLNADGIDNEMSFSHLDKQIRFDQRDEQLHVAGNKAIIYAHVADLLNPVTGEFDPAGAMGYVPNKRLTRAATATNPGAPQGTVAQDPISGATALPDPAANGASTYAFEVKRTQPTESKAGIFNGGMNVTATGANLMGASSGSVKLIVQCRGCDDHVGAKDADQDWVTVAEDYNQSPVYLQSGAVASVNLPDPFFTDSDGKVKPVEWRALVSTSPLGIASLPIGPVRIDVEFTRDAATDDGNNCLAEACDLPPVAAAYDVANTDFFADLNKYIPTETERFQKVDPRKVIDGTQSLTGLHTLVLADELLPGYKQTSAGPAGGPATADKAFAGTAGHTPGQGVDSCARSAATTDNFDFTIAPGDDNAKLDVHIEWLLEITDWDLFLQRKMGNGNYADVGSSAQSLTAAEDLSLQNPTAGDYRVQAAFCSGDPTDVFEGTVKFTGRNSAPAPTPGASDYTDAELATWVDKLKAYANGGGNLVLTDKALTGLPLLKPAIGAGKINEQTVYVGQMTVTRCDGYAADGTCAAEVRTLTDPLMKGVNQPGSRFNTGFRRQTFEPTPIGFAIQDQGGADLSAAVQYDIDAKAFTDAGGRVAATSADDGERDAGPLTNRVTVGELPMGAGQIRVVGALLPQPSDKYDHPLGVEPYAVTYSGYIVACNVLGATCSVKQAPRQNVNPTPSVTPTVSPTATPTRTPRPGNPGGGNGGKRCVANSGFRSTKVKPAGRGLRFRFKRRVSKPVTVDVFKVTKGAKVTGKRRVKRFKNKTKSFTWNGKGAKGDGVYFVRLRVRGKGGVTDVRLHTFRRKNGRFVKGKPFLSRPGCKLVRAFKLTSPAFGGASERKLGVVFKLARKVKAKLVVSRKGGGVVARAKRTATGGGKTFRLSVKPAELAAGTYRVRLVAKRGKQTQKLTLSARRL